ncbi:hypothetical protein OESDEN_00592 [Oesophagostomum dentatum]|uniref:Uncharacterized protein n=1 Tax=Oesophagostomum dentatum TaxID=61180 RepID=A0A0B1TU78_OESDE|nr:hypothetical protein OESDEN_00592 [Oesophagostomum dentatum]
MISMYQICLGELLPTMKRFERNLKSHWERAAQLSSMLETYRGLHIGEQEFWIAWTARHGKTLRDRNIFRMNYIGDTENVFWLSVIVFLYLLFLIVLV